MITKPKVGDIIRDTNDSEGGLLYRVIEDNIDRMLLECIDGRYYPLKIAPRQTIDLPSIMADFVMAPGVFVMADSNNRKAATAIEADKLARAPKGPHGWIQWKGTDVCMDVYCKCGAHSHVDAEFAYNVKCPACGTVYACNGNIELIELTEELNPECLVEGQ